MAGPGARSLGWLSLNRRPSPNTSPIPSTHTHTDEYAIRSPIPARAQSFGHDFNLIRAVEEYGPQRVESIRKELASIDARKEVLTKEMHTLERMIAVTYVGSADRDMAWAKADGHVATVRGSGFDMD